EGRAALSQGLIATASRRAIETTSRLEKLVDLGRALVVVEPSVLGLFKQDYANLLQNDSLFQKLKTNCYDSVDYLLKIIAKHGLDPAAWFSRDRLPGPIRLFYHCHCQQKSVGSGLGAETLFRRLGLDVETSQVECCGMAGSFGYKKDYYDISMAAGQALFDQIDQAAQVEGELAVLAGGISCAEQILAGTGKTTYHPMEILARMLIR
ncbi:MAG TPA: (4Fe-4S)-binding protein, partial [Candidatus Glassbacteria bacterium]|nr:(4Fe-4S)-binding protein [Candidatus Glassbacteria bacterium]